jgi:flagellar basal-body rod protein FlgC
MALTNIFGVAGSALNAQTVRMNLTASNLANATTVAATAEQAYKAKRAIFKALLDQQQVNASAPNVGGVRIEKIVDDKSVVPRIYEPSHPEADSTGYVYKSNVNEVAEMVDMMSAARSYQNNVEVVNTAREMMMRTIDILKA